MIIKRYIVDNMNEAMIKIRYELGSDAVIVSQRKVKQKGFTGIFKSKKIEVTAAVDDKTKKISNTEDNNDVKKEIEELKSMVQNLTVQKDQKSKREPKNKTKQMLIEKDIPAEIVEDIYSKLILKYPDKKVNAKSAESEIKNLLCEIIKTQPGITGRIQVLVGPTGVGKTTTIAKLAGINTLYKNKRVGLITLDTYRIGAVEQLKTYAEILGVDFGVVITTKDIPDVIDKMKNCDLIFVDTTGRSSKNIMQVSEIRKFVEDFNPDMVHLVLSMTTKQKDIIDIINSYKIVNFDSLILTKVDETDVCGPVLTAVYNSNVPISYVSTGQNVPQDIEEANAEKLVDMIMGA